MRKVSERQREVLRVIVELMEERGYSPTLREVAERVGLGPRSHNAVYQILDILRSKGVVTWEPHRFRTLKVLIDPDKLDL